MAINKRLLVKPPSTGITPSEHFGVVLYEGDSKSGHSINGGKFGAGVYGNQSTSRVTTNYTQANGVELTWSFWVFSGAISGIDTIIGAGTQFVMALEINKLWPMINGSNRGSGTSITTNTWHHFAITYNGSGTTQVYKDGSLDVTVTGQTPTSMGTIKLFDSDETAWGVLEGKIDQVRIFQKVLSSSEVSTLYAETAETVTSLDPLSEDTTDTLQVLGDSSCLALYKFENNEDDESGNYNATSTTVQYAAGRYGQGVNVNNDGVVTIPTNITNINDHSLSVWFNTSSTGGTQTIFEFDTGNRIIFRATSTDSNKANFGNGGWFDHGISFSANTWYHLVITFKSGSPAKIYVNGSLEHTTGNITKSSAGSANYLGANNASGGNNLLGTLDQFRVFNKELSASEVTTLYQENSLVASYRFEGNALDDMKTYDGTASNVTYEYGLGFTPDLVWAKPRTVAEHHYLLDSTRGPGYRIHSNLTAAQSGPDTNRFTSFDSGGFTVGSDNALNQSGQDFVAWCWKANGGTTSSNTDGSITTTVQSNTDAGFSILKYNMNLTSGTFTIGHGLNSAPELVIFKTLGTSNSSWIVYPNDNSKILVLDSTGAASSGSSYWNSASPTSTVINMGTGWTSNHTYYAGDTIAYAFHSVDGFSKIGSYTGNGSTDGPIVETGFEVQYIMIKRTDTAGHSWLIYDSTRSGSNFADDLLYANTNAAENPLTDRFQFLSNGFKILTDNASHNASGGTYIYIAFAADPDTEAPTVAKSFDIQTYNMTGGSDYDLSFAFKPQFVVTKTRDEGAHWSWGDIIRGNNSNLSSNDTNPVNTTNQWRVKDWYAGPTSVTIAQHATVSTSNISYAWKADDNEPTIEGGAAKAVYKFEDNANDVTGNYNGTASNVSYSSSGKFNKAADFSTGGANIAIGSPIPNTDTAVSVSAWIYLNTDATSYETVIGAGSATASSEAPFRVNVRYVSANTYKIEGLRQIAGTYYNTALSNYTDSSMAVETWHHVVWTYHPTGRTLTTYLNGSKVDTLSMGSTGSSVNDSTSVIGNFRNDTTADNFSGLIDQVRIYSGKLEDEQVSQLYAETSSDNDDLTLGGPPETIISANANAGFSIVQWEGTGTQTQIQHGLSAAPEMIISKRLDSTNNWSVYHKDLGLSHTTYPNWLYLNLTSSEQDSVSSANHPYYAAPSSTVIYQNTGTSESTNVSGGEYISYCFHSVSNFCKIGSYAGNGTTNAITTGFRPDFLLIKVYDNTDQWVIIDSVRGGTKILQPNLSNAESTESGVNVSFTSTGFTHTGSGGGIGQVNSNGNNYIYAAFKIN